MSVDVKEIDIIPNTCHTLTRAKFQFYFNKVSNENYNDMTNEELKKRETDVVNLVKVYQHLKYCSKCEQGYLEYKSKLVSLETYCGKVPPEAFARIKKNEIVLDTILAQYETQVKEEKRPLM